MQYSLHNFYIPVMGTGFTVDSALFVGKYGIDTVVSLVDDLLLEEMRQYWSEYYRIPYAPIKNNEEDARAKRVTAYLDLLNDLVNQQVDHLRQTNFENPDLNRFFQLLPEEHVVKQQYLSMLSLPAGKEKELQQAELKTYLRPGYIHVNIMAKLDPGALDSNIEYRDLAAASALRGFAKSKLNSMIILSAGFNPLLYNYLATLEDFYPDVHGNFAKQVCLKVSDYRSALIQGKYLAKRGIWVSEYRFESPINCGGHAFINEGTLMGPILEEFALKRAELQEILWPIYQETLSKKSSFSFNKPLNFVVTAQGGIGTPEEHRFLKEHYKLDALGWGSPFLLAPDVTNVDRDTLDKLIDASSKDIFLSGHSPLGVPFWMLRDSLSEKKREERISRGKPGSPCFKGFVRFNHEFTAYPLCLASREYQKAKLLEIYSLPLSEEEKKEQCEEVLAKSCICNDLGGGVLLKRGLDLKANTVICPGPNLAYFRQQLSLTTLVEHIYGRTPLILAGRPHVFINELKLHLIFWLEDLDKLNKGKKGRKLKVLKKTREALLEGIAYYRKLFSKKADSEFSTALSLVEKQLNQAVLPNE